MESFSEFMTKVLKRRKIDGKKKTRVYFNYGTWLRKCKTS